MRQLPNPARRPVDWRKAINKALRRTTGHRLVKVDAPRAAGFKHFHDDEARATMTSVRDWTMTGTARVFALIVAVRYVVDHEVAGDMVECGVWRGGSMQAVAWTLLARGVNDRHLHLFDTFEGMPPPTDADRQVGGRPARDLLASRPRTSHLWAIADLEDVQVGMARTGYPTERIHYAPGLVQDTIPAQAPEQIALLRLDTDWYESTRHELEHLYDRVTPGGVLIFDDYDYWEGSRRAVDEFLAANGHRLLLLPVAAARIAVKS